MINKLLGILLTMDSLDELLARANISAVGTSDVGSDLCDLLSVYVPVEDNNPNALEQIDGHGFFLHIDRKKNHIAVTHTIDLLDRTEEIDARKYTLGQGLDAVMGLYEVIAMTFGIITAKSEKE